MPVGLTPNDEPVFTLVCGHLSSRICLAPEPKRAFQDAPPTRAETQEPGNANVHTLRSSTTDAGMDSKAKDREEMVAGNAGANGQADDGTDEDQSQARVEQEQGVRGLGSVQRQTLHNQGSVLASDLSIIGFMDLHDLQSPPVLSRHWITLDRPQSQDAVASSDIKEGAPPSTDDSPTAAELKAVKVDDSLASTLFPTSQQQQQQQQQPSFFQQRHQQQHSGSNSFQQRQQHHQQQHQQFQPNFGGQQPGMMQKFVQPNLPPTSSMDQSSHSSPSFPHPNSENDSEVSTQDGTPQQHLYSTLYKALCQESMVAIVALQYPNRNCVRLRKWRHSQDEASNKGPRTAATSSSTTAPGLLSKRLSHSQGSSPNLSISSTQDLHASGGSGLLSSSFSLGASASSSLSFMSGAALKDDLGSAISMASLSSRTESDREWCGILMAAPHFLKSSFHSAPVRLDNGPGKWHAPWLPDLNHDRPVFPIRMDNQEARSLLVSALDISDKATKTGTLPTLMSNGMEHFGNIKGLLRDIKADLTVLLSKDDISVWDRDVGERIRQNFNNLKDVQKVYGYKNGLQCALRMFDSMISSDENRDITVSRKIWKFLRRLCGSGDLSDLKCNDFFGKDSGRRYQSESEESMSKGHTTKAESGRDSESPKRKKEKKDKKDKKAKKHKKEGKKSKHRHHRHDQEEGEDDEDEEEALGDNGDEEGEVGVEEEEEEDAELEGGSVSLRRKANVESIEERRLAQVAVDQEPESKRIREAATIQPPEAPSRLEFEAEDEEEQDLVMEQSSVAQTRRPPINSAAVSRPGSEPNYQPPPARPKAEEPEPPRLKSPGMAPQKRRRQLLDDTSDDSSSVEGTTAAAPSPAAVAPAPSKEKERKSTLQKAISTANTSASSKAATKLKRIKAEPVEEPQESPSPASGLKHEVTLATGSTRALSDQQQQQQHHLELQAQQPEQQERQQQLKGKAKQKQHAEDQLSLQEQQRPMPSPSMANQHQRTPSGTPQWLAANSAPSLITNIKVPARTKKIGVAHQQLQPPHQDIQQGLPPQPQQAQSLQEQMQPPMQPPMQHQQQQQQQRVSQQEQQVPHQTRMQEHQQEQRQEQFAAQQPVDYPGREASMDQSSARYALASHSQSQQSSSFYAEPLPPPEMHQRHSVDMSAGPDPRQPDSSRYPSRPHTPPQYQRHTSGSIPPSSLPHAQPDQFDQSYRERGSVEPTYAPVPTRQLKLSSAGAHHSGPLTDEGLNLQQRQQRDYEQRQEKKFMKQQMMQKRLEQGQRSQHEQNPHQLQGEHPDQMANQQRELQRGLQRDPNMQAQRQQEWTYPSETLARHGPPPQESRGPSHYAGQAMSAQDAQAYSGVGQYQQQDQPQQQYAPQRAHPVREHPEPTGPTRQGRSKPTSEVKYLEEEERRFGAPHQDLYLQQQQQRYEQQRQEQMRQQSTPGTQAPLPPQQQHLSHYSPASQAPTSSGRRSAQHSRSSSASGHQDLGMMMNPVQNPPSAPIDQSAARDRPMAVTGGGPPGAGYPYPPHSQPQPSSQSHSRSRGSSPSMIGYSTSHGPAPVAAPVSSGGLRQSTHSRSPSMAYEVGGPYGAPVDPSLAHVGPGHTGASFASQPPSRHHARHGMESVPSTISQQQQQPQSYGRYPQEMHPQEVHPGYGHASSRSQDMSSLVAQHQPPRSHNRSPSEAYSHPAQVPPPALHPSQQQQQQHYPSATRHGTSGHGHPGEPPRMAQSRSEQQWYQEQQEHPPRQGHHPQHYAPQAPGQQQQPPYQQGHYQQQGGQGYRPSHASEHAYPSPSQAGYPPESRHPPQPGPYAGHPSEYPPAHQAGPGQGALGHSDPSGGTGNGSGSSGGSGGGSRISLRSLLN
ncbi:hypothetical protein BGZ67_010694 [Mortierella alpina]|nr:hypothetical protein BGZ67_010694 [Mortierella alpina]